MGDLSIIFWLLQDFYNIGNCMMAELLSIIFWLLPTRYSLTILSNSSTFQLSFDCFTRAIEQDASAVKIAAFNYLLIASCTKFTLGIGCIGALSIIFWLLPGFSRKEAELILSCPTFNYLLIASKRGEGREGDWDLCRAFNYLLIASGIPR